MTKATPRMRTQRFLCGASFAGAAKTWSPSRQRVLLPEVSDRSGQVQQTRIRRQDHWCLRPSSQYNLISLVRMALPYSAGMRDVPDVVSLAGLDRRCR